MPAPLPGFPMDVEPGRRENPLPGEFAARVRVFSAERHRKLDPACAPLQIPLMLRPDHFQVTGEVHFRGMGEQRDAVLVAFPFTDDDLVRAEIDIFDPQPATFEHSEASPVQEGGHQVWRPVQVREDCLDLVAAQDDG